LIVDEKKLQVDSLTEKLENEMEKFVALENTVNDDKTHFELAQTRKKLARKEKLLQEFGDQLDKDQKTIKELHGSYEMHLKLLRVRGEVISELEQTEKTLKRKLHAAQTEIEEYKVKNSKVKV
jgi:chromosome segregation ATPase